MHPSLLSRRRQTMVAGDVGREPLVCAHCPLKRSAVSELFSHLESSLKSVMCLFVGRPRTVCHVSPRPHRVFFFFFFPKVPSTRHFSDFQRTRLEVHSRAGRVRHFVSLLSTHMPRRRVLALDVRGPIARHELRALSCLV